MAFDGAFISQLVQEINNVAMDSRIDKIHQPTREELIISLRTRQGGYKLLLSAGAGTPRFHFTKIARENPKSPPMFCMLMRKHLTGGKFLGATQINFDRVVHFLFEASNELGDKVKITIAVEIMGRHSNIIVFDQNNKIIDSIKRIDEEMSSVRQVLPGMMYELPPARDQFNIMEASVKDITTAVLGVSRDTELSKAIMTHLCGISPLVAREIALFATRGEYRNIGQLTKDNTDRLEFYINALGLNLKLGKTTPTMLLENGVKPKEFSFMDITQYENLYTKRSYDNYGEMMDSFFSERDAIERMKQRSNDLLKLLSTLSERTVRRVSTQKQELAESVDREKLRIYGDILAANLHTMEKGMESVTLNDFYSEDYGLVDIKLDIMLTPVQNSQKYYSEYRKAATAEKKLIELIKKGEEETEYIDSVFDSLVRARSEEELDAIRTELASEGYIKNYGSKYKKQEKLPPIKYRSSDGFTILVGRNNLQNDKLTLKTARNYDMWFHTQKIAGSHVVVVADGKEIPNKTLEEAAIIAAYNSKARESSKVAVDYTIIKNIKKPVGAKPGMVIYDTYQTAIVNPDGALVNSLIDG